MQRGEIWPGGVCHCTIVFQSDQIGKYDVLAYLDIDGQEARLPLSMCGLSKGPDIKLNVDSISIGDLQIMQVFSAQVIKLIKICGIL